MERQTFNVLPSLTDVLSLVDLDYNVHFPDEMEKRNQVLQELRERTFNGITEVEEYLIMKLPSYKGNFRERLIYNLQQFFVFRKLLSKIEKIKTKKSFFNKILGGVYEKGEKIRPQIECNALGEAVKFFKKKRKEWSKYFLESSGNIVRWTSSKYLGVEPVDILRVIKRTFEGQHPFHNQKKLPNEGLEPIGEDGVERKFLSIVYCLLKYFRDEAPQTYIQYLLKYGFKQYEEALKIPNHFDRIFYSGLAEFVFFEKTATFTDSRTFVLSCEQSSKLAQSVIDYGEIQVDPNDLKLSDMDTLKERFFSGSKDSELSVRIMREHKEKVMKEVDRLTVFKETFKRLFEVHGMPKEPERKNERTQTELLNNPKNKIEVDGSSEEEEEIEIETYSSSEASMIDSQDGVAEEIMPKSIYEPSDLQEKQNPENEREEDEGVEDILPKSLYEPPPIMKNDDEEEAEETESNSQSEISDAQSRFEMNRILQDITDSMVEIPEENENKDQRSEIMDFVKDLEKNRLEEEKVDPSTMSYASLNLDDGDSPLFPEETKQDSIFPDSTDLDESILLHSEKD